MSHKSPHQTITLAQGSWRALKFCSVILWTTFWTMSQAGSVLADESTTTHRTAPTFMPTCRLLHAQPCLDQLFKPTQLPSVSTPEGLAMASLVLELALEFAAPFPGQLNAWPYTYYEAEQEQILQNLAPLIQHYQLGSLASWLTQLQQPGKTGLRQCQPPLEAPLSTLLCIDERINRPLDHKQLYKMKAALELANRLQFIVEVHRQQLESNAITASHTTQSQIQHQLTHSTPKESQRVREQMIEALAAAGYIQQARQALNYYRSRTEKRNWQLYQDWLAFLVDIKQWLQEPYQTDTHSVKLLAPLQSRAAYSVFAQSVKQASARQQARFFRLTLQFLFYRYWEILKDRQLFAGVLLAQWEQAWQQLDTDYDKTYEGLKMLLLERRIFSLHRYLNRHRLLY